MCRGNPDYLRGQTSEAGEPSAVLGLRVEVANGGRPPMPQTSGGAQPVRKSPLICWQAPFAAARQPVTVTNER